MQRVPLEKLRAFFESKPSLLLAYLFGSQASGKVGPLSDLDVGVWLVHRHDDFCRGAVPAPVTQRGRGDPAPTTNRRGPALASPLSQADRFAWISQLHRVVALPHVDLVVLNQASPELNYHIIKTGIPIFIRERATQVDIEAYVLARYLDYLPILRAQRNDLLNIEGDRYETGVRRYRATLRKTENVLAEIGSASKQTQG